MTNVGIRKIEIRDLITWDKCPAERKSLSDRSLCGGLAVLRGREEQFPTRARRVERRAAILF
jgi:hypothetical protein